MNIINKHTRYLEKKIKYEIAYSDNKIESLTAGFLPLGKARFVA